MSALVALVYRQHTGCRQYPFETVADLRKWCERKPYREEIVRVIPVVERAGGLFPLEPFTAPAPAVGDELERIFAELNAG